MNKEINIFKKIGYSIGKVKKYDEMSQEGVLKALKYITILIILFSFIIAGLVVCKVHQSYEEQIEYIQANIPELSYAEGILKFETENEMILSDEIVEKTIGGTVIINTNNYSEELKHTYIEQITSDGEYGVILFSENMIMVGVKDGETQTYEYGYTEVFESYFDKDLEFNKQDVISYLENISYFDYFIMYTVTYFISMFIIMAVNILVMSLIGLIYVKLLKINVKYKNVLSMSIYASTISIILNIIYYLIQFIFNIAIPYFDVIYIAIPYAYLIMALFGMRQDELKTEKN